MDLYNNNISDAGAKEIAEALYYREAIGGFPKITISGLDGLDKALTDIRALKPNINNIKPKSLSEPKDNSEMNNKITELQGQVTTVKYNNPNSQSRNPTDINRDVIGLESNQNNIILELQELKEKTKEDKSKSQKEIDDLKKW